VMQNSAVGNGFISQRIVKCPTCEGSGQKIKGADKCKKCKGKKIQPKKESLEVRIEKGMRPGRQIIMKGLGDEEPGVPEAGDLIIVLKLKEHPTFTMKGLDLKVKLQLSLREAILGFDRIIVQHLDGRMIKAKKPEGQVTRPGDIDLIKGQGMPSEREIEWGDLYVEVSAIDQYFFLYPD
jgi:DnaJ homolog subfamily A member 2